MNPTAPQPSFEERPAESQSQMAEIPSYPVEAPPISPEQAYIPSAPQPVEEQYVPPVVEQPHVQETIQPQEVIRTPQFVEAEKPEESDVPSAVGDGENAFRNPELGQSSFAGGVTPTQVTSRVGGYAVSSAVVNDPHSGLLQRTASSGDPTKAGTAQSMILMKILQAFWKILGIN